MRRGRRNHVDEFGFIARRHQHHVREAAQIGNVEGTGMGGPIRADEPGAIERETDRQVLQRHIMHDLVIGALQKGGIDGTEWPHPVAGKPGGEGHRVLLGDADIEETFRKPLLEEIRARP